MDHPLDGHRRGISRSSRWAICTPLGLSPAEELCAGEVGYIDRLASKRWRTRAWATPITGADNPAAEAAARAISRRSRWCSPASIRRTARKYGDLRDALEKLQLNDASLTFEPETSVALGFGFRCGFLGLLHMEIIQERLEREYNLDLITTAPSVVYKITKTDGDGSSTIDNAAQLPRPGGHRRDARSRSSRRASSRRTDYVGAIMELCQDRRGEFQDMQVSRRRRAWSCTTTMPLNEIIYDFFDALKSRTRGYALARL